MAGARKRYIDEVFGYSGDSESEELIEESIFDPSTPRKEDAVASLLDVMDDLERDINSVDSGDFTLSMSDQEPGSFPGVFYLSSDEDVAEEEMSAPMTPSIAVSLISQSTPRHYFLIDPTNMSLREASILTQFLLSQLNVLYETLVKRNKPYTFNCTHPDTKKEANVLVEFSHDISEYISEKYPYEKRFAVINPELLAKGSYSELHRVEGKLKLAARGQTNTFFFVTSKYLPQDKQKVARYQKHDDHTPVERSIELFELTQKNRQLGWKYPMWAGKSKEYPGGVSVSIMRCLKDDDLDKVLSIEAKSPGYLKSLLQTQKRWDLSDVFELIRRGMLQFSKLDILLYSLVIAIAYKRQVTNLNLAHRDVKAENIMIDLAKGPVVEAITFVDFEFARLIGDSSGNAICGTPGYMAPEVIEGKNPTSNKSDIWALGCTLAGWFGDRSVFDPFPAGDRFGYQQSLNRKFKNLDKHTPLAIIELLAHTVAHNPAQRPDIDEIIQTYSNEVVLELIREIEESERMTAAPSLR